MNCQNLEYLYLYKHDELMTTFTFTLNLFDKYKYSIKIMLFLLKNLIYKDSQKIKLPRSIISNIQKLLLDQATVQGIIGKMKDTLNKDNIKNKTFYDGAQLPNDGSVPDNEDLQNYIDQNISNINIPTPP
jgi:hypothetical protein